MTFSASEIEKALVDKGFVKKKIGRTISSMYYLTMEKIHQFVHILATEEKIRP